ncbi:TetR/AcrR family transcriptional regulator [Paenibacillus favisporus]|uniref:TetR/AcrR family transcriptional regulator n=1 Tax=Paenibacillus favisporus TaxID=221028 RepID=UPI002DBC6ED6|nr:TetR/AcrR family transcriptional regulator [Paenibacillus favisporus]MEC0176787.1 TetR/AcrR family transcriptional regulator [Paenibacillus favisporus]
MTITKKGGMILRPREFEQGDIVNAAMQVFWEHGYFATSIQDLVDATCLGRGSLYNAFGSKHELFQHSLRRYQELRCAEIALLVEPGSIKDKVRRFLMGIVEEELGDDKGLGCMTSKAALELASHDEKIAAIVSQNFNQVEMALFEALKHAQGNGEIALHKDARALARFVLSTAQGLRVLSKGYPDLTRRQILVDVVDITIDTL